MPTADVIEVSKETTEGLISETTILERVPVSRKTWQSWRNKNLVPCVRLPGSRRVLYHWASVQEALLRQQRTT